MASIPIPRLHWANTMGPSPRIRRASRSITARSAPTCGDADDVARLSALRQLDHLREYGVVSARIAAGTLRVHAWFYDVATGEIEAWCPDTPRWHRLDARLGLPAPSPA